MAEAGAHHPRRRTFGPVVLLGLAAAGLASVSATHAWVTGQASASGPGTAAVAFGEYGESPLAAALGLVLLATWGVLLVTRGVFRRIMSWLGAVAAAGYAVTAAVAPWQLRGAVEEAIRSATGTVERDLDVTVWWGAAIVAAGLACVTSAAAALWARHWPEMGTRYDAPTGPRTDAGSESATVPTENIDIWKALDEGRDPTT